MTNHRRKAVLEQQRLREEQIKRRAAEQSAAADPDTPRGPRRVEVIDRPVHDGMGGKFTSGQVVTETTENSAAIDAWLANATVRIVS